MTALFAALVLAVAGPLAATSLAAAPPAAAAPAATSPGATSPGAAEPGGDASAPVADLQQIYDQSCAAREYGAYDDVCDQLRRQIRQAQAELARQPRRKAATTDKAAAPTPP